MGRGNANAFLGPTSGPVGHTAPHSLLPAPHLAQPHRSSATPSFAHPAEEDLARILSFYRIRWVYEPTTFHLETRDDGRPAEQITPDFYLPDYDLYLELTTMRQRLVTRKNRKIRRLREMFPSIHIKLLYRRDYDRLIGSYPVPDLVADPQLGPIAFDAETIHRRVSELAGSIVAANDHRISVREDGRPTGSPGALHLVGVGAGSRRFLHDLAAELDRVACCVTSDVCILSRYGSNGGDNRVRVGQLLKTPVAGRDIVLVADIVSSGLSLVYLTDWMRSRGARSVRICALLDREDARIIDIPLDYVGFRAPDEVLVGYGLATYPQFGSLPWIATVRDATDA